MRTGIKPIKTEKDYEDALAEIERLFDATTDSIEADRLEILATLVEDYENKHYSIPTSDPVDFLKYYLESRGLTRKDLEPYLGDRSRVSEILNRKRSLSIEMIRRLHEGLKIPAEVLIRPYQKAI